MSSHVFSEVRGPAEAHRTHSTEGLLQVSLHVLLQAGSVREALVTLLTGEGPLSRVNPGMTGQSHLQGEAFAAHFAEERPGPRVRLHVVLQRGPSVEALVALRAGEGLGAGVNGHVVPERGALAEAFVALLAGEGLLPGVGQHVALQVAAVAEALPALLTEELGLRVNPHVAGQVGVFAEAFATQVTEEGLCGFVGEDVAPEGRPEVKAFTALSTAVGRLSAVDSPVVSQGGNG